MTELWRIDLTAVQVVPDGDVPGTLIDVLTEPAPRLDCERTLHAWALGVPFVPDTELGEQAAVAPVGDRQYRVTRARLVRA